MKDFILNFFLRVVFGVIAIYTCNTLFTACFGGILHLGINDLNLLTIGSLGVSGFGLVLAISVFAVL